MGSRTVPWGLNKARLLLVFWMTDINRLLVFAHLPRITQASILAKLLKLESCFKIFTAYQRA